MLKIWGAMFPRGYAYETETGFRCIPK